MRHASPVISWYTESHSYNDSNKNQKNEAQKMAEWTAKNFVEKLKEQGSVIISVKPIHFKNTVKVEIKYIEA